MIKGNAGGGAARSCFHTQASLSRTVIDAVAPPGGGSKQIDAPMCVKPVFGRFSGYGS
jgi:hypothetical protein